MTVNIADVLKRPKSGQLTSTACFALLRSRNRDRQQAIRKTEKSIHYFEAMDGTLRASQLGLDAKRVGIDWLVKVELTQLSYPISRKGSALRIDG